jgi:multicomponent Na+:H+ antiporter subunit D
MYIAMGIGAAANTVIGLFPSLLYDLLPHAVEYTPYSFAKVLEKSQILLFTALAFWILLDRLHAKAKVSIDTDWLYRSLPALLVRGTTASSPPGAAVTLMTGRTSARTGTLAHTRGRVLSLFEPSSSSIVPTWTLGAVILVTSLLILIASLTP